MQYFSSLFTIDNLTVFTCLQSATRRSLEQLNTNYNLTITIDHRWLLQPQSLNYSLVLTLARLYTISWLHKSIRYHDYTSHKIENGFLGKGRDCKTAMDSHGLYITKSRPDQLDITSQILLSMILHRIISKKKPGSSQEYLHLLSWFLVSYC